MWYLGSPPVPGAGALDPTSEDHEHCLVSYATALLVPHCHPLSFLHLRTESIVSPHKCLPSKSGGDGPTKGPADPLWMLIGLLLAGLGGSSGGTWAPNIADVYPPDKAVKGDLGLGSAKGMRIHVLAIPSPSPSGVCPISRGPERFCCDFDSAFLRTCLRSS